MLIELTNHMYAIPLGGVAQREQRNPQFDFLKPTHMLFGYFTQLVDAYAKVLQPSSKLKSVAKEKVVSLHCFLYV